MNPKLVGVLTSVADDTDEGSAGTGVKGGSGIRRGSCIWSWRRWNVWENQWVEGPTFGKKTLLLPQVWVSAGISVGMLSRSSF